MPAGTANRPGVARGGVVTHPGRAVTKTCEPSGRFTSAGDSLPPDLGEFAADRRVVLLRHAGGDAPAAADGDAWCILAAPGYRRGAHGPARYADRRRCPWPALRACSIKGASCLRNALAFFLFRSIAYSVPSKPNHTVS